MSALAPCWLVAGCRCERARHGHKAEGLAQLLAFGFEVPPGFALSAEEVRAVERDGLLGELAAALGQLVERSAGGVRLAVRASPALDLPGALPTFLDVACEPEAVRAAISAIVAAEASAAVRDQLVARGLAPLPGPWVGVVVQEFIHAEGPGDFGGVVCSCDPRRGTGEPVGELLFGVGAQPVVSGRTRPLDLIEAAERAGAPEARALVEALPGLAQRAEVHFGGPVELELVTRAQHTYLLEARALTLSPAAYVARALEAVERDDPAFGRRLTEVAEHVLPVWTSAPESAPTGPAILSGLCACSGSGSGIAVFDAERALAQAALEPVVLVRDAAEPSDVAGFRAARAVLTTTGGITCHAAVIARSLNVPALVSVSGTGELAARSGAVLGPDGTSLREARGGATILREGERVFVDASRGRVYAGEGASPPEWHAALVRLFAEIRKLRPRPIWVEGELEPALAVREACQLDGVLVRGPRSSLNGQRRGREVYWCIPARSLAAELSNLPPGFGIVLERPASRSELLEARKALRGRSLGIATTRALAPGFADAGLDLLILEPDGPDDLGLAPISEDELSRLESVAPRRMWRGNPPSHTAHVGVIVPVQSAAAITLGITGERAGRAAGDPL